MDKQMSNRCAEVFSDIKKLFDKLTMYERTQEAAEEEIANDKKVIAVLQAENLMYQTMLRQKDEMLETLAKDNDELIKRARQSSGLSCIYCKSHPTIYTSNGGTTYVFCRNDEIQACQCNIYHDANRDVAIKKWKEANNG